MPGNVQSLAAIKIFHLRCHLKSIPSSFKASQKGEADGRGKDLQPRERRAY
jgi:hypothetical protein